MLVSDAELVARARQGDVEAFGELIGRYEKTVLAAVLAKLGDVHTTEDVVQAAALRAFRRLDSLRDAGKFGPWLVQIARRQAVDALRARRSPVSVPLDDCPHEAAGNGDTETWIEHEHLLSLVGRLPKRERVLIGQRYFDAHSLAEIAELTGRSIGTVSKQLSRAVARLRSWWDKENLR